MLSIVRLFICYIPIAYLGSYLFGLHGFFFGAVVGNLLMAVISYRLFVKQFNNRDFMVKEQVS